MSKKVTQKALWPSVLHAEPRFSNWDEGCLLLFQTRSGQDDKFDLRSCALGQGAFANTVLVGPIWRWKVFPGLPDASARNVVETRSEVIGRTVKDRDRGGAIFTTPRSNKHRFATDGKSFVTFRSAACSVRSFPQDSWS